MDPSVDDSEWSIDGDHSDWGGASLGVQFVPFEDRIEIGLVVPL